MLRKIGVLCVISLFLLLARPMAWAQTLPNDPALLADRMINLEIEEVDRYKPIKDLVDIDPEIGFTVLRDNWTKIHSSDAKQSLINTFLCAANPHIVEVIQLGATDPNLAVQTFAMNAAETLSFRPMADDYKAYLEWHKAAEGKTLLEVLIPGVQDFVARFKAAPEASREPMLEFLLNKQFNQATKISHARRKAVIEAGVLEPLAQCLEPKAGVLSNQYALQIASRLKPDKAFLQRSILPLAEKNSPPNLRYTALQTLGSAENSWAVEPLLKMLVDEYPDQITYTIGTTLGAIGDPDCIPTLIGMLDADNTREGSIVIGNVLSQVTGVIVNEAHDAGWWHNWLTKNGERLPLEVRQMPIPKVILRKRAPDFNGGEIIAPNRAELHTASADPKKSYWLIIPNQGRIGRINNVQPQVRILQNGIVFNQNNINVNNNAVQIQPAKPSALGLLVVLAADGSGANAVSFWQNIAENVFKGRYIIALPVAPLWDSNQKVAWITAESKKDVKQARFTTESFVSDIVKEVAQKFNIDTARVFLHGVGESGPAVYAASLEPTTPFKGFYLLAAPFKSAGLPLKLAKGRRYFLQHSKEDKANPYLLAAAAQKLLTDNGAVVKLVSYRGKGYTFDDGRDKAMNDALVWLETGK